MNHKIILVTLILLFGATVVNAETNIGNNITLPSTYYFNGLLDVSNLIGIPPCSGTDKLTSSDGQSFTCASDQIGSSGVYENLSNKSTDTSLGTSNDLYPSQNAVKSYVDTGLATKEPTIATSTANKFYSWDKTWRVIDYSYLINVPCFNCSIPATNITGAPWLTTDDDSAYATHIEVQQSNWSIPFTNITGYSDDDSVYATHTEVQQSNWSIPFTNITGYSDDDSAYLLIATYSGDFPNTTIDTHETNKDYPNNSLQTAVGGKEPTISVGTTAQYWRGDKSWQTLATDVRATLSGTAPITYNSGTGAIGISKPAPIFMTNATATCTDSTNGGTGKMMGFGITHTTATTGGTGVLMVTVNFQLTAPATSGVNTQYQLSYGTLPFPVCGAGKTGTQIGQIYTFNNPAAVATKIPLSDTVVISGLAANTAYWFDVNVIDSSTASWIYSLPQVSVHEE